MTNYVDISGRANYSNGQLNSVDGLIIHHTGGRGSAEGVVDTLNGRGLGVQYVMDRDGTVYQTLPDGARGAHMESAGLPKYDDALNNDLNNGNAIGIEVIAKNDADVTPAQRESAKGFISDMQSKYPGIGDNVYGHGEENPGHKEETEGMTIVNDYRNSKGLSQDDVSYDKGEGTSGKGGERGSSAADNAEKKGDGKGDDTKKADNEKTTQETKPLQKKDKEDVKGTPGNYQKSSTQTIVSRMPTHEPWSGHPKSTEGPRQAIRGDGGNNEGGGSGGGSSGSGSGTGSGGGSGSGSNIASNGAATNPNGDQQKLGEQVYDRLRAKGWSDEAATASVGNFMGEGLSKAGGYGTAMINDPSGSGKPGTSRGIGQWRNERGVALENFANGNNPTGTTYSGGWRNIDAQADFYDYEMKTQYGSLYNSIKTSTDSDYVVRRLVNDYERPAEYLRAGTTAERQKKANGFRNKRGQGNKPRTADPGMNKGEEKGSPVPAGGGTGSLFNQQGSGAPTS